MPRQAPTRARPAAKALHRKVPNSGMRRTAVKEQLGAAGCGTQALATPTGPSRRPAGSLAVPQAPADRVRLIWRGRWLVRRRYSGRRGLWPQRAGWAVVPRIAAGKAGVRHHRMSATGRPGQSRRFQASCRAVRIGQTAAGAAVQALLGEKGAAAALDAWMSDLATVRPRQSVLATPAALWEATAYPDDQMACRAAR